MIRLKLFIKAGLFLGAFSKRTMGKGAFGAIPAETAMP
jgi:hypothetical protein